MNAIEAEAVDVLLHTKDILLDGWGKGALYMNKTGNIDGIDQNNPDLDKVEKVCLAGALRIALAATINKEEVRSLIAEKMAPLMPAGGIYPWNDCEARTQNEVVDLVETLLYGLKGEPNTEEKLLTL